MRTVSLLNTWCHQEIMGKYSQDVNSPENGIGLESWNKGNKVLQFECFMRCWNFIFEFWILSLLYDKTLSCPSKRLDEMPKIYEWILNLAQLLLDFIGEMYECQLFFLIAQGWPKELDNHFSIYSLVDTLNSNLIALNSRWATCDENSEFHVFKFKRKFSQSIRSKLIEPIKGYSGTQLYYIIIYI